MKKLLFVALIGTFVACGEATETETTEAPVETVDTTVVAPVDTTVAAPVDTTATDTTTAPAQ